MSEEQFEKYLLDMNKHANDDYNNKLVERIFNRYANQQEQVIDEESFSRLAEAFQLSKLEGKEFFLSVADLKNQISF